MEGRPDDSLLDANQLVTVQRHADRLLREASAIGRFPTPVGDLLEAAKLIVVDDAVLDENALRQFLNKAKARVRGGIATIKSALSKVLGLYECHERLVVIDNDTPKPRVPFIKLHEAGHGTMPHQNKVYHLIHDCEKTLDNEIADLFEREANVFASEVLFQGEVFSAEAHGQSFGIKVPMTLAKKYGASNYSTFRRYARTNPHACCVVVLEPCVPDGNGGFTAEVRRVVMSKSFEKIYDDEVLCSTVNGYHPPVPVVPKYKRRLVAEREIILVDRNHDQRVCTAAAFDTRHNTFVLIRDVGKRTAGGVVVPAGIRVLD